MLKQPLRSGICVGSLIMLAAQVAAQSPPPGDIPEGYRQRELQAPVAVRLDIENLRQQAQSNGWTFKVGATTAMTRPLSELAGTTIPENFLGLAVAQNEQARRANGVADESALLAGVPQNKYLLSCKPGAGAFNWRDNEQRMTPVRYQQSCGSCWAFTALAAYEGAYFIRQNQAIDTSEQSALNCSPPGTCVGGWYYYTFTRMLSRGIAAEADLPYKNVQEACDNNIPARYPAVSWGFVTDQTAVPLVSQLKEALCTYGPLAVAMVVTPAFQAYVSGVFNENGSGNVNHAVTLVGWDDNKNAWLVKNSWDEWWGESGYVWMRYNSNKIGYAAAWVRPPDPAVPVQVDGLQSAINLTTPAISEAEKAVGLSSTAEPPKVNIVADPNAKVSAGTKRPVWIQYANNDQRQLVEAARKGLREAGFLAPDPENVREKAPNELQVRYFREADEAVAKQLAETLSKAGAGAAKVLLVKGYSSSPLEIWFPKQS